MSNDVIFANSYGYRLQIATGDDLTLVTSLEFAVQRTDGTVHHRSVSLGDITSPAAGVVDLTVLQPDFTQVGIFTYQLLDNSLGRLVVLASGSVTVQPGLVTT